MLVCVRLVILSILALGTFACTVPTPGPHVPTPTPRPGTRAVAKVLRIARTTFPTLLDPQKSWRINEVEVLKLCYEPLLVIDPKGMIGPGAAERFELASDGTSMTFRIREGLTRADGSPLNASDFEYALRREVDPRVLGKEYTDVVHDIKGALPLIEAEGKRLTEEELNRLFANYGVRSDDAARSLTVTFNQTIGYWHYVASTWVTLSPEKKNVDAAPDNWWAKAENHNCYGPFTIKTIDEGKRIVYEANPRYWRGKPILDRIEVTYTNDDIQRLEAYKAGEFEVVDVTPSTLAQIEADAALNSEFVRYPGAITRSLQFNNLRKPTSDKNVRIAISQAWDRKGWVREVLNGVGIPTTRWIPPGVPGAQPDRPGAPDYDPKAALETLLKGGYGTADGRRVDCTKLGELKLTFLDTESNRKRYRFLANNLETAFGCPVPLEPVNSVTATGLVKDAKTHPLIAYGGWVDYYPHPQSWLSAYWKCDSFVKRFGYCNKENDALMARADATLDFGQSIRLYQQIEDNVMNDLPFAFGIVSEHLYLIKPYLIGFRENTSFYDTAWPGEWGPIWTYDVDITKVPATYPK